MASVWVSRNVRSYETDTVSHRSLLNQSPRGCLLPELPQRSPVISCCVNKMGIEKKAKRLKSDLGFQHISMKKKQTVKPVKRSTCRSWWLVMQILRYVSPFNAIKSRRKMNDVDLVWLQTISPIWRYSFHSRMSHRR